jgi:hypothetical protein
MTIADYLADPRPRLYDHGPYGYPTGDMAMKGGINHIPARALCLSRPGDVVQVHPDLSPQVAQIFSHYRRIGLPCAASVYAGTGLEVADNYPDFELDVFLFCDQTNAVRPNPPRHMTCDRLNNKNRFIYWCIQNGLPVPQTVCYGAGQEVFSNRLGYPVFVKAAVSGSGMHVIECDDWDDTLAGIAQMPGPFQLQAKVKHEAAINVLYYAHNGRVDHIITTQQLVEGSQHKGNIFPTRYDPRFLTDKAAAAVSRSMEGFFGFDGLVDAAGDFWFMECNPRPNASTYYAVTAHKLGVTSGWTGRNLPTSKRALADVDLGELEYDPDRGTGIVIVGWGSIPFGMLGLLFIGDPYEQARLLSHAQVLLA